MERGDSREKTQVVLKSRFQSSASSTRSPSPLFLPRILLTFGRTSKPNVLIEGQKAICFTHVDGNRLPSLVMGATDSRARHLLCARVRNTNSGIKFDGNYHNVTARLIVRMVNVPARFLVRRSITVRIRPSLRGNTVTKSFQHELQHNHGPSSSFPKC